MKDLGKCATESWYKGTIHSEEPDPSCRVHLSGFQKPRYSHKNLRNYFFPTHGGKHFYYLSNVGLSMDSALYEGRTESHEQLYFACELGTADEGDCGGRWNQLLCYP